MKPVDAARELAHERAGDNTFKFVPRAAFEFGDRKFYANLECICFRTTKYDWIIQPQPGMLVFARKPIPTPEPLTGGKR